jgi:ABC-type antimicrobial peptide transport system permease subunit
MAARLQPLSDVHFNYGSVGHRTAHKPTLYSLLAIGVFLLLLGCINFINLTTAQSAQRAKEIGVRKTIGGSRKQLVFQFLSETFVITILASVLAVLVVPFLLRMFRDFIPDGLQFNLLSDPSLIVFLILLVLAISFLAGIYPAWILSRLRTVSILKGPSLNTAKAGKAGLRKVLTVSQFVKSE